MALSLDLRKRIVEAYEKKEGSMRTLAKRFSTSLVTVWQLLKRHKETGDIKPKSPPGRKPCLVEKELKVIERSIKAKSDITLQELNVLIKDKTGKKVSLTTIHRACKRLNFNYKKSSLPC